MPNHNLKTGLVAVGASSLLFASFPARCAPPFVTDDPETVEYQHYEMNIAYQQVGDKGGKTATPLIEINYGALPDLQVGVSIPYVVDKPSGQLQQNGWGDVVLSAKYRFQQETDEQPMMAISPAISVPTGNAARGLGNGKAQLFLPLWIQKSWGAWHLTGGGGYSINFAPGVGNNWYFGMLVTRDVSEKITVGGEVFHTTEQFPLENSITGFNIGGIYNIDQNDRLFLSVGRGLITEEVAKNAYSAYFGYGLGW
jgi:hypothetical protein